jgi:hypothetical protein
MATSGRTNATSASSSSSSSAYSNGGFYDDEQDEDDNMTKGGSYIDIPISNPSNEVKKLLIENIPLYREQLRTVISRASFQVSNCFRKRSSLLFCLLFFFFFLCFVIVFSLSYMVAVAKWASIF